ncbi:GGDEF domain-containing protein [Massilia sp. G4R7]|uniref:diguanylate cyclase n=1 Tax=Massilia phyllostachyos TaxID=2898585 RepID=A0ABS8QDZ3_9BURK|nr:GGDEF domain-containing protein [Massilia phyllostachyos]MCD2518975.1 GGDEF domain-containing protein [Massilia phyllostachyos]
MLLVLSSLAGTKVAGIRAWGQANGLAVISLLLFASRGIFPDVLSLELANALLLATIALMHAGFCHHLGRPVPLRRLVAGAVAAFCGLVYFHHVHESLSLRITSVSVYHASVCFAIYRSVPVARDRRLRYPFAFTRITALVLACGHAFRGAFYALDAWEPVLLVAPDTINLVFVALGTLAMPALTLGAVMMANGRALSDAAYAADHDHLTGAPSRRAFFDVAERELARAQRKGSGLGLLLVDADHFKRINDTFGHGVGDQVLRDLVRRTQEVIRKIDYCARLGGEEFAVLLPDASPETASMVAERLRRALDRSAPATNPSGGPAYTVSIGLAMLEPDESFASLMQRADKALYAAKAGGRNRVVSAVGLAGGDKG